MNTTSASLLDRLKRAEPGDKEWGKLHEVYMPLIRQWLFRIAGLRDADADDVTQEVLLTVVRELSFFERRRQGSFRAWLKQITVYRIHAFRKARGKGPLAGLGDEVEQRLARLEDPNSDLSREWDRDHDKHVFRKLMALVRPDFEPTTWEAFTRFALEGHRSAAVAEGLGVSESAVIQAKFRILKRLREEAGELTD